MGDKLLTWILSLLALGFVVVVAGVVVLGILAVTGSVGNTGQCVSDEPDTSGKPVIRGVSRNSTLRMQWQDKWNKFDKALDGGQSSSTTFTESETSSRAQAFLDKKKAPISEAVICFHDGDAEARGKVNAPIIGDIPAIGGIFETDAKIRGTIDLSGPHPKIVITDVEAGNLPGFALDQLETQIQDIVNSRLDDLNLDHTLEVAFAEGSVTVNGSP